VNNNLLSQNSVYHCYCLPWGYHCSCRLSAYLPRDRIFLGVVPNLSTAPLSPVPVFFLNWFGPVLYPSILNLVCLLTVGVLVCATFLIRHHSYLPCYWPQLYDTARLIPPRDTGLCRQSDTARPPPAGTSLSCLSDAVRLILVGVPVCAIKLIGTLFRDKILVC
jgi:hypothetical protein